MTLIQLKSNKVFAGKSRNDLRSRQVNLSAPVQSGTVQSATVQSATVQSVRLGSAAVKVPSPFFAHLYIENKCHLKCGHCYESDDSHPFKGAHLSVDEWSPILDGLKRLGVMVLTFSGGEPFLRKDFDELLQMAREKRFSTRIYTSGTHIDAAWAKRLAELEISDVQISLHSTKAEVHDEFTRGKRSFTKTLNAVRLLRKNGVKTLLKVTVMKFNVDELDAFCDLAEELDSQISFSTQVLAKISGDETPLRYQVSPEELAEKFYGNTRVSRIHRLFQKNAKGEVCVGEAAFDDERRPCGAGEHIVTIGANGDVFPCAIFGESAGNAVRDDVESIWKNSFLMKKVRETRVSSFAHCTNCENKVTCAPCMAQSQTQHGDLHQCNPSSKNTAVAKRLAVLQELGLSQNVQGSMKKESLKLANAKMVS